MPFQNKKPLIWIAVAIVIAAILGWGSYRLFAEKKLEMLSPNGGENLLAGRTYQIQWQARNVGNIEIVLINEEEPRSSKVLARDISSTKKKYDWNVFVWEKTGQNYKIAIFEYPWQEGNKIDYSDNFFSILGPQFASCDELSIGEEWPFVPSDLPDLRKVFITQEDFSGNLEGLQGADKKCQAEAEREGREGTWKAFLGDDQTFAVDRLNLEGIFIQAESSANLPEGKTCHRLLGKNFEEFSRKLSVPLFLNQEKLEGTFLDNLSEVWLGRITRESKRECTSIFSKYPPLDISRAYSLTTTCQNWTTDGTLVPGYPLLTGQTTEFPVCYTPQGVRTSAVGLAGLASGLLGEKGAETFTPSLGKSCSMLQRLLCIEQ